MEEFKIKLNNTEQQKSSEPKEERVSLTKVQKRKLWELKGRDCEECGLHLTTGGKYLAIHPFRPENWNGEIKNLRVLCSNCLGRAASERDKLKK